MKVKVLEWSMNSDRKVWHHKDIFAHFVNDPEYDPQTPENLDIELGSILGKDTQLTVTIPTRDIEAFLRVYKNSPAAQRKKKSHE